MPQISVIIPVYNSAKYISKCLESVLNQTFKDIEIICVNDKSQDNSLEILNSYAKNDNRIKIIDNKENKGAALSRNEGVDNANGKYIYFIDDDDYIDEKYLECMFNKIEQENCDVVLNMSIQKESNDSSQMYQHPSLPKIKDGGEYLDKITTIHDAPCFIWARLFKKTLLDRYNIRFLDIRATDDVVFNAIVNMYTNKTFVFYGEKYHYTVSMESVTGQAKIVDDRDFQHIKAYSMIYDYLNEKNLFDNRLKLYRVFPFFKVNTEEKFSYYKKFFEKIEKDFHQNEAIYNDLEKFFAYSLLNSADYEEYLKNYNKVVTIGFLRQGKKELIHG